MPNVNHALTVRIVSGGALLVGIFLYWGAAAYSCFSFDLVLDEWLDCPAQATSSELGWLVRLDEMSSLMAECASAAMRDKYEDVDPLIERVVDLIVARREAIHARIAEATRGVHDSS